MVCRPSCRLPSLRGGGTGDREEVDSVALRKHGEGEVIPETEQQKTAAKDGDGMSKQAAEELRAENEEADRVDE